MTGIQPLPQELIDHIIDLSRGTEYLKVLSMVSTAWRTRSQRHLFRELTLDIYKMKEMHSEISKPTGTAASQERISTLFSYVRLLCIEGRDVHPERHGVYLRTLRLFTNVTDLKILLWEFEPFESIDIINLFDHFGKTVTKLDVSRCRNNTAVLILLKSLFPLVDDLRIHPHPPPGRSLTRTFRIRDSEESRSAVFRGKLDFEGLDRRHDGFLAFVGKNCLGVHSIALRNCRNVGEMQELLDGCKAKLTSVSFGPYFSNGKFILVR